MQSLAGTLVQLRKSSTYNTVRNSFDNTNYYKGHNSVRFHSLNNGFKQIEKRMDEIQSRKLYDSVELDQLYTIHRGLKLDLTGYHNECMSPREKEMFGVCQIESEKCENPQKLKEIQEKLEEKRNSVNCFYNDCYENFQIAPSQQSKKRLAIIEESLKHIFMGLQNQDADIIAKHDENDKTKKYTDEELSEFEQNHQFIFSLLDDFMNALQQQNDNPLQVVINSREQNIPDENKLSKRYKKMYANLENFSQQYM